MQAALRHLRQVDSRLGRIIDRVGPCAMKRPDYRTTFEALARSIAYQQLSGHAAASIYERLVAAFGDGRRPDPARIASTALDGLRAVGLSRPKADYIRSLARADRDGLLPSRGELDAGDDAEVADALTKFRGVGLWTAQMLLIFWLERPDVLPADDLGIRKGLKIAHRMRAVPSPKKVLERGRKWAPYRSTASWYLWRATELT